MKIVLVDTSVWVNYLKNISNKETIFIDENSSLLLATCPTVVQEILQGLKTESEAEHLEEYFNDFVQLIEDPYEIAVEAAELYRKLRKKGITIRKPNDCLIAMYAIKNNAGLLHDDIDFVHIAKHSDLQLLDLN